METHTGVEQARRDGTIFGIPMGELGWFQSLIMGLATGFAAFFLATFLAIVGFLTYLSITGKPVDFALTYRVIGFPVGVIVLVFALGYLGFQYVRRMARKNRA